MAFITFNGKQEEFDGGRPTVLEFLQQRDINPAMVSVQLNGKVLSRDEFQVERITDGAEVKVLFFMGGGGLPGTGCPTATPAPTKIL